MAAYKNSYIWISLAIFIFGVIFIPMIVQRIKSGDVVEDTRLNVSESPEQLAYITRNDQRRQVPDFNLLNQDSLWISNEDYLGKVYVAEFFFTTCPTICPVMTKNLVDLQNTFREDPDFGVASFTINPEYDTPMRLKQYAEKYEITDMDWHLLTGPRDSIYHLANAGFNIFAAETPDVPGGFEHSGLFALIDKQGFIRSRYDDFGNPLVYYTGTITEEAGTDPEGNREQISWLKEDIQKLLDE